MQSNHYRVIYADPPWSHKTWSNKGKTERSADHHYRTTKTDDLKAIPVSDWAAKDCVLFMWIVDSHLVQALDLIEAWGFTFKTIAFNWVKTTKASTADNPIPKMSLGLWTRKESEICLLATRGKPSRVSKGVRQVLLEAPREHSRKPDEVRHRIEALVDGPYLEMFSRESRAGWDAFGDETGKFDLPKTVADLDDLLGPVSAPKKSRKRGYDDLLGILG